MKINSITDLLRFNRTKERLKKQKELTDICAYDVNSKSENHSHRYMNTENLTSTVNDEGTYYHLLSEGLILYGDGTPMDIVGKGAIKAWYDSLDESNVYDIDLQHEVANPLFRQIGTWTKSDLKLEEDETGRYSVHVKLNLDEESIVVKELKRKSSYLGLSAEFYSEGKFVDFVDTEGEIHVLFLHESIDIIGFGIVGEPADAKSGNITLNQVEVEAVKEPEVVTELEVLKEPEVVTELEAVKEPTIITELEAVKEPTIITELEAVVEPEDEVIDSTNDVLEDILNKLMEIEKKQSENDSLVQIENLLGLLDEQSKTISELSDRVTSISSFTVGGSQNTPKLQIPTRRVGF